MHKCDHGYFENYRIKWKTKIRVGTVPKSNQKIVVKGKIDTSNTHIHDHTLSWLGVDFQ